MLRPQVSSDIDVQKEIDYSMGITNTNSSVSNSGALSHHSESTNVLASPPKKGTSNRSNESAATVLAGLVYSKELGKSTILVCVHGQESDEAEVSCE